MMSENEFALWFSRIGECIEIRLRDVLQKTSTPDALMNAMHDSLLGGGKRLRPAMLLAVAGDGDDGDDGEGHSDKSNILCNTNESAELAACAIECIHCYSLVHDDLPCMDDADSRRGLPSCHKKHGEAMALLAGDCLQSLAFQLIAESQLPSAAAAMLATAAGASGMGGGQTLDLIAECDDESALCTMHQMKTGALFRCALLLGLMCRMQSSSAAPTLTEPSGRASIAALFNISTSASADALNLFSNDEQTQADAEVLQSFATSFGLLFQIANDIKDADADSALGKKTYCTLLGMEEARRAAATAHRHALAALDSDNDSDNQNRFSNLRYFADRVLATAK